MPSQPPGVSRWYFTGFAEGRPLARIASGFGFFARHTPPADGLPISAFTIFARALATLSSQQLHARDSVERQRRARLRRFEAITIYEPLLAISSPHYVSPPLQASLILS
jgi:hypothetical protein